MHLNRRRGPWREIDRQTDAGVNNLNWWVEVPRATGRIGLITQWERLYPEVRGPGRTAGEGPQVEEEPLFLGRRGHDARRGPPRSASRSASVHGSHPALPPPPGTSHGGSAELISRFAGGGGRPSPAVTAAGQPSGILQCPMPWPSGGSAPSLETGKKEASRFSDRKRSPRRRRWCLLNHSAFSHTSRRLAVNRGLATS